MRHTSIFIEKGLGTVGHGLMPSENFTALDDHYRTLEEFMVYCNITSRRSFSGNFLNDCRDS